VNAVVHRPEGVDVEAVERDRHEYERGSLDVGDVDPDPLRQLEQWIAEAFEARVGEPNAMTLATVGADGHPDARIVLLRGITPTSLVWFTDRRSSKGTQLAALPQAALVFHWQPLERQARLRGPVVALGDAECDAYFASRPRDSRLSAWASHQSQPTPSRKAYERQVEEIEAGFDGVEEVPRPPYWGGYALTPEVVELWQGRRSRRHDRLRFTRSGGSDWAVERLQP